MVQLAPSTPDPQPSTTPYTFVIQCGIPAIADATTNLLELGEFRYDPAAPTLLVIDTPFNFAFATLPTLDRTDRHVIVASGNTCTEYWADLWDLQPDILLVGVDLSLAVPGAIRRAAQGERYRATPSEETPLTPREREILYYLVRGWSDQRIAYALSIKPKTVRNTLSTVYKKLGVGDRVAAALRYWGMDHVLT